MSRKIKDVPTSPLLENATDNNVGDLISRQQAIRWVKTECNPYGKPTLEFESGKRIIEHLENMPPTEPKRGRWIDKGITGDWQYQIDGRGRSWHEWQCDQCKDMVKKRSFYCPNCGADMREVTT